MQEFYIKSENTRVINMVEIINEDVRRDVEEDLRTFAVTSSAIKNKFIFFRVCNYILEEVKQCRHKNQKLLLYVDGNAFDDSAVYISAIRSICKGLSICLLQSKESFTEFYNNIIKKTGESKDRRNKINCLCNKQLKNPNISQFTRLLLSKGIHKIDGTLNSLEVKLGLYTT